MPNLSFNHICNWLEIFDFKCLYDYKRKGYRVIVYKHKNGLEVEIKTPIQ